jgi:hypothetical protein
MGRKDIVKRIGWHSPLGCIIVIKMTAKYPQSTALYSASYVAGASGRGSNGGAWPRGKALNKKTISRPASARLDGLIVN